MGKLFGWGDWKEPYTNDKGRVLKFREAVKVQKDKGKKIGDLTLWVRTGK